jgi:hypothetical protein
MKQHLKQVLWKIKPHMPLVKVKCDSANTKKIPILQSEWLKVQFYILLPAQSDLQHHPRRTSPSALDSKTLIIKATSCSQHKRTIAHGYIHTERSEN